MAADWAGGLSPVRGMEQVRCLRWAGGGGNWVGCEEKGEAERKKMGVGGSRQG